MASVHREDRYRCRMAASPVGHAEVANRSLSHFFIGVAWSRSRLAYCSHPAAPPEVRVAAKANGIWGPYADWRTFHRGRTGCGNKHFNKCCKGEGPFDYFCTTKKFFGQKTSARLACKEAELSPVAGSLDLFELESNQGVFQVGQRAARKL